MPAFHLLAALLALFMLARHGRRAMGLFTRAGAEAAGGRAGALVPLLVCAVAAAVLWLAARALLGGIQGHTGGPP